MKEKKKAKNHKSFLIRRHSSLIHKRNLFLHILFEFNCWTLSCSISRTSQAAGYKDMTTWIKTYDLWGHCTYKNTMRQKNINCQVTCHLDTYVSVFCHNFSVEKLLEIPAFSFPFYGTAWKYNQEKLTLYEQHVGIILILEDFKKEKLFSTLTLSILFSNSMRKGKSPTSTTSEKDVFDRHIGCEFNLGKECCFSFISTHSFFFFLILGLNDLWYFYYKYSNENSLCADWSGSEGIGLVWQWMEVESEMQNSTPVISEKNTIWDWLWKQSCFWGELLEGRGADDGVWNVALPVMRWGP